MRLSEGFGNPDGDAQKMAQLHRRTEEATEQFAAGILKHQNGLTAVLHKLERPCSPRAVKLILQRIFVG